MASKILSSTSYVQYLNDYIHILLKSNDRYLIDHLNENYLNEIENYAYSLLNQWYGQHILDKQSTLYIENVGYLNRKICLLTETYYLNQMQLQCIDNLLFNSQIIELLNLIIKSLLETNQQHNDDFLKYLSIFLDAYSAMKYSKPIFNKLTEEILQSNYYKEYLIDLLSSDIQPKHLFFIGSIGQLALPNADPILNQYYSEILEKFSNEKNISNDFSIQYCILGIVSQLDLSYLIDNLSSISILRSIILNEDLQIFSLPILNLFNLLSIQSKTVACYLNNDQLIDFLLQYVVDHDHCQTHTNACLLLGHIINEEQLIKLRISYRLLMKLIHLLTINKQQIDRILQSLLSLTIHQQIQMIIADTYQLKVLIQLSKDYPILYEIIWKLSFHPAITEQLILRHEDFLKQLSMLTTIPAVDGILQNIQIKNLSCLPVSDEISYDLSLISSSKDQHIVEQLKENLLKKHIRIGTISNSSYILLCISEESKHDCSCQAAVQQALLQYKKILLCIVREPYRLDDWFSKLHSDDRKIPNLLKSDLNTFISKLHKDLPNQSQLPSVIKQTRIITPSDHPTETTFTLSSPSPSLINIPRKKIQNWTNREVLDWCQKNKLTAFIKILSLYDGRNLLALAHVSRMSAPHTIINQLRNDCRKQGLNLSFVEFVRFQSALDELLRLEKSLARKQSMSTLANRYVLKEKK